MKTTLDLPDVLVHEIQLRAAQEGRDITEFVAEILTAGMSPSGVETHQASKPLASTLPLIKVRPVQTSDVVNLTTQQWCNWIKDIDLQLEVERYEQALGHQHVDRADS